jgi:tetratricopeptide (TPR) repeat protein
MTTEETIIDFETKLAACDTDEERCEVIYKADLFRIDFALAKKYNNQLLDIAQKSKSDKHFIWGHRSQGRLHLFAGEFAQSLSEFNIALEFARASKDVKIEALLLNDFGVVYSNTYLLDEAIESIQCSLELLKKIGDWERYNWIRQNLASAYSAIGLSEKALEIRLDLLNNNIISNSLYQNMVLYHIKRKEFLKAKEYLELNEKNIGEATYLIDKLDFHATAAKLFEDFHQFEEASKHLAIASELWKEYNSTDPSLDLLSIEATLCMKTKDWQRAETCLISCLSIAKELKIKQNISWILELMKELFLLQDNRSEAFEYANQYIEIEKEIKSEQLKTMQKMLDVKQKFAVSQKEKEITEEKNKIIEKEKTRIGTPAVKHLTCRSCRRTKSQRLC